MKAKVHVTLKPGVLDPQGRAVHGTLARLGFSGVQEVRIGKLVELELADGETPEVARARVEEMCRQLLANTVIEDYRVEIIADADADADADAGAESAGERPV